MERLTKRIDEKAAYRECSGPCGTCDGTTCFDIGPMVDRLAAYEDTGLTPEEIAEADNFLKENYDIPLNRLKEAFELIKEKDAGRISVMPPNDPLTLDELRKMGGEPVWCLEMRCWGIIKLETIGQWAGIPFLIGALHDRGVAVDFEYDVVKRELTLYRRRPEEG